jgi:hypothetical protein
MAEGTSLNKSDCAILLLCFLSYCGPSQAEVERTIENGVEVVLNHIEPYKIREEPSIQKFEERFTIDTELDEVAEIGLTDIRDFGVDSEGNIYCLNTRSDENTIFKFNGEGERL